LHITVLNLGLKASYPKGNEHTTIKYTFNPSFKNAMHIPLAKYTAQKCAELSKMRKGAKKIGVLTNCI